MPSQIPWMDVPCSRPAPGAAQGPPNLEVSEDPAAVARRDKQVRLAHERAKVEWRQKAQMKNWDTVQANMEVYRHSGEALAHDPRRVASYRDGVAEALLKRPGMYDPGVRKVLKSEWKLRQDGGNSPMCRGGHRSGLIR